MATPKGKSRSSSDPCAPSTRISLSRARSPATVIRRDLPLPAGASISTTRPRPSRASARAPSMTASSASRSTSGARRPISRLRRRSPGSLVKRCQPPMPQIPARKKMYADLARGPSARLLLLALILLLGADWGSQIAGDSFIPGGPLDETAHLMTTLLVVWALGPGITRRFMVPALFASVLIDLDHVPQYLGDDVFTLGTPRPYTHSLTTVLAVVILAALWRRRREVWLGVAL